MALISILRAWKIMTLKETCKACGFKSAKQVAELNGFSPQYLNRLFREDKDKLKKCILKFGADRIEGVFA